MITLKNSETMKLYQGTEAMMNPTDKKTRCTRNCWIRQINEHQQQQSSRVTSVYITISFLIYYAGQIT